MLGGESGLVDVTKINVRIKDFHHFHVDKEISQTFSTSLTLS